MDTRLGVRPGYQASSLLVSSRPDEIGFPLREDEFRILREGDANEARAGRDFCLGSCLTAALGLLGIVATADWVAILQHPRKLPFIVCAAMLGIAAGCGTGSVIYHRRSSAPATIRRIRGSLRESPSGTEKREQGAKPMLAPQTPLDLRLWANEDSTARWERLWLGVNKATRSSPGEFDLVFILCEATAVVAAR
jgi:hypothetical protein